MVKEKQNKKQQKEYWHKHAALTLIDYDLMCHQSLLVSLIGEGQYRTVEEILLPLVRSEMNSSGNNVQ